MLMMKKLKKDQISLKPLFHVGGLCSKTLDGLDQVKKCMKFFNFCVSIMLLT